MTAGGDDRLAGQLDVLREQVADLEARLGRLEALDVLLAQIILGGGLKHISGVLHEALDDLHELSCAPGEAA